MWTEKENPMPFDATPIPGMFYLDGDVVAEYIGREWTKGEKYPMIAFPSGEERALWESGNPDTVATVHLFGEMDLPLKTSRDEAYLAANDIAEQVGYQAVKRGETDLEVWGHDQDEHLLITYDPEAGWMANIVVIHDEQEQPSLRPMELLPEEIRERLPKLYENEHLGLEALAQVKFFTPDSGYTWYASEFDGEDILFGLVAGHEIELGYFSLSELREVRGPLGLPIERDLYYDPKSLRELRDQHRRERGE